MIPGFESCYRAVQSRDPRFDGWFFTAVHTTGIYCRPSCPATTPKAANVSFYPSAAAAQAAGYRACKRCRPDATPDSPEWDARGDVVGRAVRLIRDGVVDRDGVGGLARRLGYSDRQLQRVLLAELGSTAQGLARAQRAETARLLVETTDLPLAHVAFAAGFASVRQFNDTIRQVFAATPTALRKGRSPHGPAHRGAISLRLPARSPFAGAEVVAFLAARAIPPLEHVDGMTYTRTLALDHGGGVATLEPAPAWVDCTLRLDDLRDLASAVARCRRLFDLDADPVAVDAALSMDPALAPLVAKCEGRRVPGAVDPTETVVRAILGQQVSLGVGVRLVQRLLQITGDMSAAAIAAADLSSLALPDARRRTLQAACAAIAAGDLMLGPGADRLQARRDLLAIRGVGEWTADYVAMRALRDPDAFPAGDGALRRAMRTLDLTSERSEKWRPWRAYAVQHLWAIDVTATRRAAPSCVSPDGGWTVSAGAGGPVPSTGH